MSNGCSKEVVTVEKIKAMGPYSLGIKAGPFVFCSGQVGIDPEVGKMVEGGVEAQTRQVMKNLSSILEAAGSSLSRVVKTTVFLIDINDFARFNAVYAEFFSSEPPARSTYQVGALPGGASVEIECIALRGDENNEDCSH